MAAIVNHIHGTRKIKLRVKDPMLLNASTVEVIDSESREILDGVVEITLPQYKNGQVHYAEVKLRITDIEVTPYVTTTNAQPEDKKQ